MNKLLFFYFIFFIPITKVINGKHNTAINITTGKKKSEIETNSVLERINGILM